MNLALSASTPLRSDHPVESCKAAIFQIADHWFALPATAILKIIPASALVGAQEGKLSLWENHPLVQLDLHPILAARSSPQDKSQGLNSHHYSLIVRSQTGDRCAISVDKLPILLEISLPKAQVLPSHYRQSISNIARYMIAVPHTGTVLTVLLLDLQQVLNKRAQLLCKGG